MKDLHTCIYKSGNAGLSQVLLNIIFICSSAKVLLYLEVRTSMNVLNFTTLAATCGDLKKLFFNATNSH